MIPMIISQWVVSILGWAVLAALIVWVLSKLLDRAYHYLGVAPSKVILYLRKRKLIDAWCAESTARQELFQYRRTVERLRMRGTDQHPFCLYCTIKLSVEDIIGPSHGHDFPVCGDCHASHLTPKEPTHDSTTDQPAG